MLALLLSCTDLTQELAGNLSRLCSRSRLFLTLALLLFCRRRRQRKIGALRRLIRGWRYARAASQTISLGRRALGHSERSLCVGNVLLRLVVGLARIALALVATPLVQLRRVLDAILFPVPELILVEHGAITLEHFDVIVLMPSDALLRLLVARRDNLLLCVARPGECEVRIATLEFVNRVAAAGAHGRGRRRRNRMGRTSRTNRGTARNEKRSSCRKRRHR
mmetsp:Transcript_5317/g.14020  ORF Transcript_5317/g.14020 Transcript_5317/m.14020 type:complete len:222 (-) Transcript_5317:14-679(-)